MAALLNAAEPRLDALAAGESLVAQWAEKLATLGQPITARGPHGLVTGRAVGVVDDGALVIEADSGERVNLYAGEVTLGAA